MAEPSAGGPAPHELATLGERAAIGRIGSALFGGAAELPSVDRYEIHGRLGAGAFGTVYRAWDPQLRRELAIKITHHGELDPQWIERQRRESRALARLAHPDIVGIYDVGTTGDGRWFIAMELVGGGDLRRWLTSTPPPAEIITALEQAGRGLAAAHAGGVVHRDFKPDNILLGERAKVGDFGLARALPERTREPDAALQRSDHAGTPAYMAPEQILEGTADARSDQFAFCVTAFEALTGDRPFRGHTGVELAIAARAGEIVGAHRLPPQLRAVIVRGLHPDPARRHRDMTALLAAWHRRRRGRAYLAALGILTIAASMASTPVQTASERACPPDPAIDRELARLREGLDARLDGERATAVATRLDRFAQQLHGVDLEVCSGTTGWELFDRQSGCLAGARLASSTLNEALPRVRDSADLVLAIDALPDPTACLDPRPAASPALASEPRLAIEQQLERARTGYLLGDDADAELAATAAAAAALAVGWTDAHARARLWSAQLALRRNDAETASTAAEQAFAGAESVHDDVLAATAAIVAVTANGAGRHDFARAEQWARQADAALARITEPGRLRARLLLARASARIATGRFEEARPLLDEALADGAPLEPATIAMLGDAAVLAIFTGDAHSAERLSLRALTASESVFGARHPAVAAAEGNRAVALIALGRYREAEASARRALAIGEPHAPESITYLIDLGIAQQCRGALDDAIVSYRAALADAEQHVGADPLERVQILVNLADALSLRGDHRDARDAVARARVELDAVAGADHPARAMVLAAEAAAARRRGDASAALDAAERAAATGGLPPPWRMPVLLELGEALLASDRPGEAIAPLREAAELTGFDARVSAQVASALARALARTGDPLAARTVAARARDAYPIEGEPALREALDALAGT